ncbi:MAG: universal stress protein [Desulfobacteraceae bacterium]|nr:universal stress protein [Desulfobacteraceae bacterium]MBC2754161.1 universal stress protein [Desulfobacteraceae bacterium]
METRLLHIFRNTPLGREVLLQSTYFCKTIGVNPVIYLPEFIKFLMYFENDVAQIDLDGSYLIAPETAREHAVEIVRSQGLPEPNFIEPKNFTASTLPDIPVNFDFMCCPRTISDLSSKIGLGYIGPRVRRIVQSARFPVLIAGAVYKPWKSVAVMFGGSSNAVNAFRLGVRISRLSGLSMDVYTQLGKHSLDYYKDIIQKKNLGNEMDQYVRNWEVFDSGEFSANLYNVPHDALVVLGAYGHGVIKEMLFGSIMEKVQSVLPNNLLIVGPKYQAPM